MFDVLITAAEWYLGGFDAERVPDFASEALERGYSGQNLATLASLSKPTRREVQDFMDGAFRELRITPLTKDQAALVILDRVKCEAATGRITAANLTGKLLLALPALEPQYLAQIKSYYGNPGNYSVFFHIVRPMVEALITRRQKNDDLLQLSVFIEEVCKCEDPEAVNVLWMEIFEWLVHSQREGLKYWWPSLGPSSRAIIRSVARRRRETDNLP